MECAEGESCLRRSSRAGTGWRGAPVSQMPRLTVFLLCVRAQDAIAELEGEIESNGEDEGAGEVIAVRRL